MIQVGQVYYNTKRGNCLRVEYVTGEKAHCLSWRPGGAKGSKVQGIRTKMLEREPYQLVRGISISLEPRERFVESEFITVYGEYSEE